MEGGPVILKTTEIVLKEIFFYFKNLNFDEISCASCHQTVLPRKEPCHQTALPRKEPCHQMGLPGTNLVTKRRYPEQTLSPNGVTRNKPCHQTVSPRNKPGHQTESPRNKPGHQS